MEKFGKGIFGKGFNVYGDSDDLPVDVQAKKDANKKKSKLIL